MKNIEVKLELIKWIFTLEDEEIINDLKMIKDSSDFKVDWWNDLTDEQKSGIEQGLKDVDEGRVTAHDIVKRKYGL